MLLWNQEVIWSTEWVKHGTFYTIARSKIKETKLFHKFNEDEQKIFSFFS